MGGLGEFIFGSEDKLQKIPNGTPLQEQLHNGVINNANNLNNGAYQDAQNYYGNLLKPGNQAYNNFAAPYMNNFEEEILPMIAERYAGMGALSSSGFGQSVGAAGAGLQSKLAELFAHLQAQAAGATTNQYNQLSQTGLNYQPFSYQQKQGSAGIFAPLLAGIMGGIGGPIGAAAGGGIANGISGLFKGGAGTGGAAAMSGANAGLGMF